MEQVDIILTNAIVLTMDESFNQYEPGAVAIQKDKIVAVGFADEIGNKYQAAATNDCGLKVVMPGLVNAHTHVPMTLLRGLADDLRLDVWLLGYMMPVEREFVSPEFVRLGTKIACAEMIRGGTTSFADMYYFEDDVAEAIAEVGMRAVCSESVMKYPTPDAASYEEAIAYSRKFIKKWKNHPLIVPAIAPHAPYTCTDDIYHQSAALAAEFDVPLHTHLAETAQEVENMRESEGMPVIPYVKKQNIFDAKVIAAHCVHIDAGEIRTLLHGKAGVAHNPSSNMKLASGVAPVKKMMEVGLNVGIGTDGPASNNDLDMFEEIRLTTFLAKGTSGDPTTLPAQITLAMATRIGANAIHIGNITGALVPGNRADLIVIDINPIHIAPRFRHDKNGIYTQIVYAAKGTDVTDTMVNGKWLMRDRILLTLDEIELLKGSNEFARKIDSFLHEREQSIEAKLIAIGGATEEESFEVQSRVRIQEPETIINNLNQSGIEIIRKRHYHEYDTYFFFDDPKQGRLRYREDHFVSETGEVTNVRSRLTLIGQTRERKFTEEVMLSRSRYIAPATQSLRFYQEYFKPAQTLEIEKDRVRFLVNFKDEEFFINIDTFMKPQLGNFLEIKSRTWSRQDAEKKSEFTIEILQNLGTQISDAILDDYVEILKNK